MIVKVVVAFSSGEPPSETVISNTCMDSLSRSNVLATYTTPLVALMKNRVVLKPPVISKVSSEFTSVVSPSKAMSWMTSLPMGLASEYGIL